ncbi:hypothetical protein ACFV4N_24575 [Actinosynnema sp. NPDC059797]
MFRALSPAIANSAEPARDAGPSPAGHFRKTELAEQSATGGAPFPHHHHAAESSVHHISADRIFSAR